MPSSVFLKNTQRKQCMARQTGEINLVTTAYLNLFSFFFFLFSPWCLNVPGDLHFTMSTSYRLGWMIVGETPFTVPCFSWVEMEWFQLCKQLLVISQPSFQCPMETQLIKQGTMWAGAAHKPFSVLPVRGLCCSPHPSSFMGWDAKRNLLGGDLGHVHNLHIELS